MHENSLFQLIPIFVKENGILLLPSLEPFLARHPTLAPLSPVVGNPNLILYQ